jgi:hypothetical protein
LLAAAVGFQRWLFLLLNFKWSVLNWICTSYTVFFRSSGWNSSGCAMMWLQKPHVLFPVLSAPGKNDTVSSQSFISL